MSAEIIAALIAEMQHRIERLETSLSLPPSLALIEDTGVVNPTAGVLLPASDGTALFALDQDTVTTGSVANNGTVNPFSAANNFAGLIEIWGDTSGGHALFLCGGGQTVLIAETVANKYTATKGTANRTNVSYQASIIEIENKSGGSLSYHVAAWRTRNSS